MSLVELLYDCSVGPNRLLRVESRDTLLSVNNRQERTVMTWTKISPNRTLARGSKDSHFGSSRQRTYEKATLSAVEGRGPHKRYLLPKTDLLVRAVAIRFPL
jgi:hypothetical protein